MIRFGERKYGETYAQALEIWPEYSYQSLRNMVWMSERMELSSRLDNVSWDMHRAVADAIELCRRRHNVGWVADELEFSSRLENLGWSLGTGAWWRWKGDER